MYGPAELTSVVGDMIRLPVWRKHPVPPPPLLFLSTSDDGRATTHALRTWLARGRRPAPVAFTTAQADALSALRDVIGQLSAPSRHLDRARWQPVPIPSAARPGRAGTAEADPATMQAVSAILSDLTMAYHRGWAALLARVRTARPVLLIDEQSGPGGRELLRLILAERRRATRSDPLVVIAAGDGLREVFTERGTVRMTPLSQLGTAFEQHAATGKSGAVLAVAVPTGVLPAEGTNRQLPVDPPLALSPRTTHYAVRGATLSTAAILAISGWIYVPGYTAGLAGGCFSSPLLGDVSSVVRTAEGECVGIIDTPRIGVTPGFTFGRDPQAQTLQSAVLGANQPIRNGDLTVVWLGSLSCATYDATFQGRCAGSPPYQGEIEELQALQLAQTHAVMSGQRLHVALADAGQSMRHADIVADLIVQHRQALGSRVVVVGGGDSRTVTQTAINRLLDAGIPVIAPTLTADPDRPGAPFVDRPGYLQLTPTNTDYAGAALKWASKLLTPGHSTLVIYRKPAPTDLYTTSLVTDIAAAATARSITTKTVDRLDPEDRSICGHKAGTPPAAVFFADRWTTFADFVKQVNSTCGRFGGPTLVVNDGSVSRFMNNDFNREQTDSTWPLAYFTSGPQCNELRASTNTQASTLIKTAADVLHQDCHKGAQLGAHVAITWDAVQLAELLPPSGTSNSLATLTLTAPAQLTQGTVTVQGGSITKTDIQPVQVCVEHLNTGPRSEGACLKAFPWSG